MAADPNEASVDCDGEGSDQAEASPEPGASFHKDVLQYPTLEALGVALEIDDVEIMASLVEDFLVDLAEGLTTIAGGIEANNAEAVQSAAHKLKSSCRMLGAASLGDMAEEIETIAGDGVVPEQPLLEQFVDECRLVDEGMTQMMPFEAAS